MWHRHRYLAVRELQQVLPVLGDYRAHAPVADRSSELQGLKGGVVYVSSVVLAPASSTCLSAAAVAAVTSVCHNVGIVGSMDLIVAGHYLDRSCGPLTIVYPVACYDCQIEADMRPKIMQGLLQPLEKGCQGLDYLDPGKYFCSCISLCCQPAVG